MKLTYLLPLAAIAALGLGWLALRPSVPEPTQAAAGSGDAIVDVILPATLSAEAEIGKARFDETCAKCHGTNASGRIDLGPPLVHVIYEPSHHGDMAFLMAVRNGVRGHHWRFGNMPPQDGLTDADVQAVVTYVRELQRANGIF